MGGEQVSAIVSRRSLLGWLAALPLAAASPKLVDRVAPVVAKAETAVSEALEGFGLWSNYAAYHLVRAYDIQWKAGHHLAALEKEIPFVEGVELAFELSEAR